MLRHSAPISGIASFKNQYVATAGYDNRIILWDAQTKKPLAVGSHDHLANQCEFSACGNYLVSGSSDHTARFWSLPQMKLVSVLSAHEDDVECVAIHPSQPFIVTACRDHKVRVFNFSGELLKTFIGHNADVISVQWQNEDLIILSSSDDGTIRSWDFTTGLQINQIGDETIQTDALAIASNGTVFAGDDDGYIHISTDKNKFSILAHQAGIKKIVYNKNTHGLISLAYDRKACLWSIAENSDLILFSEFDLPNFVWARSCAFSGAEEIVFATFGDSYAVYNYKTKIWHTQHIGDTAGINAVIKTQHDVWTVGDAGIVKKNHIIHRKLPSLCNFLVACGEFLLAGGQSGEIFDVKTGDVLYQHRSPLNCATSFFLKDQLSVAIGTYTGEAIILQMNAQGYLAYNRTVSLQKNAIKGIAAGDSVLFSVCATGAAAWHHLNIDLQLKYLPEAHTKIANGCVFLKNNLFASISRDRKLRLWDGESYTLVEEILTPHTHSIKCIAIDDDKRFLATGSYNGMVAIYDLTFKTWTIHRPTNAGISSLFFDITSNHILASSYDGHIYPVLAECDAN